MASSCWSVLESKYVVLNLILSYNKFYDEYHIIMTLIPLSLSHISPLSHLRLVVIDSAWVPHDTSSSLYIRPTMIGTEPTLGVAPADDARLFVLLCPVGPYYATGFKPVNLLCDPSYVRAWPGGCGFTKMGSNYAPTLWTQKVCLAVPLQPPQFRPVLDRRGARLPAVSVAVRRRSRDHGGRSHEPFHPAQAK